MNKEIYDEWMEYAAIREKDETDALRKVLDPNDRKGVKNSYIDQYLKYYLLEYISPLKTDNILEVGCGIGRLTEYMAHFAHSVYGIDIIDKFVDDCKANVARQDNAFYLYIDEIGQLKDISIDKMFIVSVLMYIVDNSEVIKTLRTYRKSLPNLQAAVIIEQLKSSSQLEYHEGRLHCSYRTIEEYIDIFTEAGFRVKRFSIMGERHNGIIYKLIHFTANILPRKLAYAADTFFSIDRYLMGDNSGKTHLLNERKPTDVAFHLELL